jgi:hypothetical protein
VRIDRYRIVDEADLSDGLGKLAADHSSFIFSAMRFAAPSGTTRGQ